MEPAEYTLVSFYRFVERWVRQASVRKDVDCDTGIGSVDGIFFKKHAYT